MKILLVIIMNREKTNHHALRVIEDPTEDELERIVSVNGLFTAHGETNPVLEEFYKWVSAEEVKRPNWGFCLADAGLLYGPFDKVVLCGGTE